MAELSSIISKKLRLTADVPERLVDSLGVVQNEILRRVLKILKRFSLKSGALSVGNRSETALIAGLKRDILEVVKNTDYPFLVENYLSNFDEVERLNKAIHKAVNNIPFSEITKNLTAEKRNAISNISAQLASSASLEVNITRPVQQILFRSVQAGSTFEQAEEVLRTFIAGDERRGVFERYVGQIANDAILHFDGQVNQMIMNEFDLDAIRYLPGLVKDSRSQCIRWVNDFNGILRRDQLPAEVEWARERGQGYNAALVLTVDNFCRVRGGYSCRHTCYPFRLKDDSLDKLNGAIPSAIK